MAALQTGGDTARACHRHFQRIGFDNVGGRTIGLIGEPAPHGIPQRPFFLFLTILEISTRRFIEHGGKAMRFQTLQRTGQIVNGIIGPRARAVPTGIARGKGKALIHFFRCLDAKAQRRSVLGKGTPAGIRIQRKFGIHQFAPFGRGAPGAIAIRFLIP